MMKETCLNCGCGIGDLETPYVWNGRVVCRSCHARLQPAGAFRKRFPLVVALVALLALGTAGAIWAVKSKPKALANAPQTIAATLPKAVISSVAQEPKTQPPDLTRIVNALQIVEAFAAKLEIGMDYQRYGDSLADVWAGTKPVLENPTADEQGIAGMINLAIASYRAANEAWSAEVAPHAYDLEAKYTGWELERVRLRHNLRNELLRQSEWGNASAYLRAARDIQSGDALAKRSLDDKLAQIEFLEENPPGMVDNPEYEHWSAFRPGAMASLADIGEDGVVKDGEWTTTLKELTPGEAVVEIVNKFGDPQSVVSSMHEIPAKVAKDMAGAPDGPAGIQAAKENEGDEVIIVGGKGFRAHWEEWRVSHDPISGEYTSKTWISTAVPGGVLRVMTKNSDGTTSTNELVEYAAGAEATTSLRKAFPSIAGVWQEAPGVVVNIAQTNGMWKASCAYKLADFGEVRWEMTGTISLEGKISGTLQHTLAPPDWALSQVREGELSKDHNTITGTSNWDGGSGKFTWTKTSGNAGAAN